MSKIASSPDRNTLQRDAYITRCKEDGREPREDYLGLFDLRIQQAREQESDPDWARDNMEYDLRTSAWMIEKVQAREKYAQNLYAAMCNRDFVKNDVWPLLKNQRWSCSWRHAGGIVADMIGQGDYIDWYCSGIRGGPLSDENRAEMTEGEIAHYEWMNENFVGEGHVTDEIREDLLKLGWIVVDDGLDNDN